MTLNRIPALLLLSLLFSKTALGGACVSGPYQVEVIANPTQPVDLNSCFYGQKSSRIHHSLDDAIRELKAMPKAIQFTSYKLGTEQFLRMCRHRHQLPVLVHLGYGYVWGLDAYQMSTQCFTRYF